MATVVVPVLLAVAKAIDWAFTEYLLISNIVSASLLLGLGDSLVQLRDILWRKWAAWRFDFTRTWRAMTVGFVLGVFNHYWYALLDYALTGRSLTTVMKKIVCDQAIAGPFFSSAFLIGMCLLEGKSAGEVYAEWRNKFLHIYKVDWMFWPAAQFVNFYLIPHRFRVFYVNFATLLWNTFLTYIKHKDIGAVQPCGPRSRHSSPIQHRPCSRTKRGRKTQRSVARGRSKSALRRKGSRTRMSLRKRPVRRSRSVCPTRRSSGQSLSSDSSTGTYLR
ncbi:mpv17-like protein 2 [Aplysia californica]|uniref:Mpv17-like protein 2 n=1 Tax=Aplysia californica TaxID=6500 RepID=A0ABM0ZZX4_APLCA|nr:mpv17-like protein 2 [Aplysia californica]